MRHKRTHVILPEDLLAEIDALVGQRGRSAFLIEVLRLEVNRRRLLAVLGNPEPAWKDEDHPELAEGAAAWVRRMRDEDNRIEQEKIGGAGKQPE
jgi:hypothetical protein